VEEVKRNGKPLVIGSLLALCGAGLLAAVAGLRMALDPAPEPCPLPALGISKPVADFSWSPDGRRLLAAGGRGEVWLVRFPEVRAEQLARFPQAVSRTGWDRSGTPWLVYAQGLARLRDDGTWTRFPLEGGRALSPGREWIAQLRPRVPSTRRTRGVPATLSVRPPRPGGRAQAVRLTSAYDYRYRLAWMDAETLLLHRTGQWRPTPLIYRLGEGRVMELFPTAPRPANQPEVQYVFRPAGMLYSWLLRNIPGFPYRRYWDCRVTVVGPGSQVLQTIPVGRRHHRRGANFWQAARVSPDGRLVVLRAADDTLRVLDLQRRPDKTRSPRGGERTE
jgi:hypothetical protein